MLHTMSKMDAIANFGFTGFKIGVTHYN